jgi:GNAT superfamily N-acetyltransferase
MRGDLYKGKTNVHDWQYFQGAQYFYKFVPAELKKIQSMSVVCMEFVVAVSREVFVLEDRRQSGIGRWLIAINCNNDDRRMAAVKALRSDCNAGLSVAAAKVARVVIDLCRSAAPGDAWARTCVAGQPVPAGLDE